MRSIVLSGYENSGKSSSLFLFVINLVKKGAKIKEVYKTGGTIGKDPDFIIILELEDIIVLKKNKKITIAVNTGSDTEFNGIALFNVLAGQSTCVHEKQNNEKQNNEKQKNEKQNNEKQNNEKFKIKELYDYIKEKFDDTELECDIDFYLEHNVKAEKKDTKKDRKKASKKAEKNEEITEIDILVTACRRSYLFGSDYPGFCIINGCLLSAVTYFSTLVRVITIKKYDKDTIPVNHFKDTAKRITQSLYSFSELGEV